MSDILETLKKHDPASLRVEIDDGTVRNVPMRRTRNRWSHAVKTLEAFRWVRVELLDAKGGVVGVLETEQDDEDTQDDDDDGGGDGGGGDSNIRLARVMLLVMQGTMKEFRLAFEAQLKGVAQMTQTLSDSAHSLSESYQLALRVQAANLTAPQGDSEVMDMMKMAIMMRGAPSPQLPKKE